MPRDQNDLPVEPRTREQLLAVRAAAVAKMEAVLADGPQTVVEMFAPLVGIRQTFLSYVRHMHKNLRVIRPTGAVRGRFILWELGADPTLESLDDEADRLTRLSRQAAQIGMHRDPLVAALFGPATHNQ